MSTVDSLKSERVLGHELVGSGATRVVIMNDWLSDTTSWDSARPLFDQARFTFALTDLRGYGRSREYQGDFTLLEAAQDILTLATHLHWPRFAVVGHSMSALIALHLGQHHATRIQGVVALSPPPPTGFGADEATLAASRALALADEGTRLQMLSQRFGTRLSSKWGEFKVSRWVATANPLAAAGYVKMFAADGLPEPTKRITVPVLAITGEQDAPPMQSDALTRQLGPMCDQFVVTPLRDCGHYVMQEMPPLTVALIERFLNKLS
jgi:3-oxoadipate enol-lactonase